MSISPQYESQNITDFSLFSGYVKYGDEVIRVTKDAVYKALVNAINDEMAAWEPSIAKNRGIMRQKVRLAVGSQLNGQKGNSKLTFNLSQAILSVADEGYFQYHYRQSPTFNPAYAGGYKNPSTAGTVPMDARDFIPAVKARFAQNLRAELKTGGLDNK